MKVSGFNHVTIRVSSLETALPFYRDLLQMKLVHKGNKDAYLEWGTAWICLLEKPGLKSSEGESYGVDHVAFAMDEDDFSGAVRKLTQSGVRIVRGPVRRGTGLSINFLDPDGTELELHTSNLAERMRVWS